jgi:RNA polymerase sigma factor (sigma-70 family)
MGINAATINHNEQITFFNSEKPWLNQNNQPISDDLLKIVSKGWSSKTWEKYLNWYETPLQEAQISTKAYDFISDNLEESVFKTSHVIDYKAKSIVQNLLKHLTIKQRQILELIYYKNYTEREIANKFNISRSVVKSTKKKALTKLRQLNIKQLCLLKYLDKKIISPSCFDTNLIMKGDVYGKK